MKGFTDRNPRRIGVVVVVVTLTMVLAVLFFNRNFFTSGYTVDAKFPNVAGVGPGANVLLAGVNVGRVGSVHLDGNQVDVQLIVNQGVVLPHDTTASISVETLLGQLVVNVKPISGWSHPLHNGAVITQTSIPVELYAVQNEAGGLLSQTNAGAINQLIQSLAVITQGKQQQVAQIVDGLNRFTGVVNQRQGQVAQLITAANTLSQTVAGRDNQLASAIGNLSTVVGGLAQHGTALGNLINNTQQAAAQINTLVGNNSPQLQGLVRHLQSVLGVLSQHQLDLAQGVSSVASAVTGFSSIAYSGSPPAAVPWGNVFLDLVSTTGANGVLGACGQLDQVLTQALGPDPLPCNQQSGPPVSMSAGTASSTPATSGGTSSSHVSSTSGPSSGGSSTGAGGILGILGLGGTGTSSGTSGAGSGGLLNSLLGGSS